MQTAGVRRASVAAGVVGACLVLGAQSLGAVAAPREAAGAATPTTVTATPSTPVARVDQPVVVRGDVSATTPRRVVFQQQVGTSWKTLASARTDGAYSFEVPTGTPGLSSYRVVAPAADGAGVGVSSTVTVGVGLGDPRSFAFLTSPTSRWDPCSTIGYRVNLAGAPEGALKDVKEAVSSAALAAGLDIAYRGTTTIVPGAASTTVPDDYPADTQLVVSYATSGSSKFLRNRDTVLGVGGVFYDLTPQKIGRASYYRTVQGYVVLNSKKDLPGGFGPGRSVGELGTWGQVLMHEVGHALGLDHPTEADEAQIMHPRTTYKPAVWGAGDLTGLHRLGAVSGCFAPAKGRTAGGKPNAMEAGLVRRAARMPLAS